MLRWVIVAVALVPAVFFGSAFAAPPDQGKECRLISPELRQSVQRTIASKPEDLFVVLKNGLTVLVHQQAGAELVSVQAFVRAGSVLEGKYMRAGLSHYLEHVVAGGSTRSFTEAQAKERLKAIGGSTNAYTSYDRTVYYINTAADRWKDALDLVVSYVSENVIDPGEVSREKPVIQQEMKMGESNPNTELWRLFMQTAYQRSPVRNPVIGYEEVFIKQDREALLDYYKQRYQPENITIVVSGGVIPTEALQFIVDKTRNFQPGQSDQVVLPEEPVQTSVRWEEKEVPITRIVQAMVGFPSVTAYDKDMYALDVLANLLGQGETCRLYCRLKEQENKVFSIGASNWTPGFVRGQFVVSVSLTPNQWPGALKEIEEEVNGFKTALVSAPDLEKAKKTAIAGHIFNKASVSAQAASFASSYMMTGDPYYDEEYVDGIREVTAEQVQSAARRYLLFDRMSVAVIKPLSAGQQGGQTAAVPEVCPPPPGSAVEFARLNNGLKTLIKQDSNLPLVSLNLYGLGGLTLEDRKQPGISAFTASLLTAGTNTLSKLELMKKIEDSGGVITATSDNNTYHVSIKVLKEDFDTALGILADIVLNSQFPPDEMERQRQDTLVAIKRSDENWQSEVMRLFKKNYFHDSSYGNDKLGTVESVGALKREDVLAFYRKMVNPTHSVLAVYGDVDPAKTAAQIQEKFGGWSGAPVKLGLPDETRPLKENRKVEIKNEKNSAGLFIGTNGMDVNNTERPVLDVMTAVLSGGGSPSGRIFEALRGGNQNLVYVVHAFPFYGKSAGYFGVITQTTMGNLEKVQGVVLSNLKRLADEPVPQAELDKAKETMLVSQKLSRETLEGKAQSAALNEVLGLGWDYDQRYSDLIRSITPQQVQQMAQKLFKNTLIARTLPEKPVEILATPPAMKHDTPM